MNRIILMGRLTDDPKSYATKEGKQFCKFSLAVNRTRNKDKTDFFDFVAWEGTAYVIEQYVAKGRRIVVEGSIQFNNWTDKNGVKHKKPEVIVDHLYFADGHHKSEVDSVDSTATAEEQRELTEDEIVEELLK